MLSLPPYPNDTTATEWSGMTLRQMQMQRTLVQAKMEIQKFKISAHMDAAKERIPFFGSSSSVFSRVASVFSIAEYGIFALKAIRILAPLFRRRK